MSYWCCAQVAANRYEAALHFLGLAGYRTYLPRFRERRRLPSKRHVEVATPLFPGYCFVWVELQWREARWTPGVLGMIMTGDATPAHVPGRVIADLQGRERDGLIDLPRPPVLHPGDKIRVKHGPFAGHLAIYAGMRPRERVAVLLSLFGSSRSIELAKTAIEPV